jgi:N utilization substance protein B
MSAEPEPPSSEDAPSQPPAGSSRQNRRARRLAFQTLYETDISGHAPSAVLQRLSTEVHPDPAVFEYARQLVAGVLEHRREIDTQIQRLAPAWPISQMSVVDRNLLRLGIYEAIHNSSTIPVGVAIDEAVELAKLYGSESSSRFINGVLGRVVAEPPASDSSSTPA